MGVAVITIIKGLLIWGEGLCLNENVGCVVLLLGYRMLLGGALYYLLLLASYCGDGVDYAEAYVVVAWAQALGLLTLEVVVEATVLLWLWVVLL